MTMTPPDPNARPQDPSNSWLQQPTPIVINNPPVQVPAPPQPTYSQAELDAMREAVRKEEKDKLYPTIEDLQERVKTLTSDLETRQAAEQAAQQRLADEEKARQEAEMTQLQRFEEQQRERDAELQTMREELDREKAFRAREAELTELERYRAERIAQEGEAISPDLVQFITGANQKQIEESIIRVKASSQAIVAQAQDMLARAGVPPGYPQGPGLPPPGQQVIPGLPVTGAPPVDMVGQTTAGQRTLSAQEIRDMPLDEYTQYREQILQAGSQRVRQYGPYAP